MPPEPCYRCGCEKDEWFALYCPSCRKFFEDEEAKQEHEDDDAAEGEDK